MADEMSVIILAGGKSRRMGQDKRWLMLDGQPLIQHVIHRVLPLAGEIIISANDPERYGPLVSSLPVPAKIAADQYRGFGPLAGMHAGLSVAGNDVALVIAADMPFVNLALIQYMRSLIYSFDAVVPHIFNTQTGRIMIEPLHALYRRTCLPAIAAHLAADERQAFCFFPDIRIRDMSPQEIEKIDPELLSFFNVNTPEDWERALRLVQESHKVRPSAHQP